MLRKFLDTVEDGIIVLSKVVEKPKAFASGVWAVSAAVITVPCPENRLMSHLAPPFNESSLFFIASLARPLPIAVVVCMAHADESLMKLYWPAAELVVFLVFEGGEESMQLDS